MSKAGNFLEALKTRLSSIKQTAGYANTLKTVRLNQSFSTLTASEDELPLIEIVDDGELTEGMASATYRATMNIILYIATPKVWTDVMMQDLMRDVRRAIFGGSASASGNTGITLGGTCTGIRYRGYQGDLNMIPSNRIYLMRFEAWTERVTYQD